MFHLHMLIWSAACKQLSIENFVANGACACTKQMFSNGLKNSFFLLIGLLSYQLESFLGYKKNKLCYEENRSRIIHI